MCHPEENTRRAPGRAWSSTAWAVPVEYPWTPRGTSTTSTPSQSSTASLITSGSFVAPGTTVMRLLNSSSFPTLCSRHTATTSWPRSSACWTMYFPSFPDAPTMQTLMTRLGEVDLVRLTLSRRTTPGGAPGPGPLTSVTILAELGDARRFSSSREAVRYAGPDITVHQSDARRAPGHLSRQRPAALRWALFEAAQCARRPASPDHDYYVETAERLGGNRACLAVARKLLKRSFHTLRELGEEALQPA